MKHDNLKAVGIGIQMPIPFNDFATRVVLPNSSFVSGWSKLKIQDDRFHAHTFA